LGNPVSSKEVRFSGVDQQHKEYNEHRTSFDCNTMCSGRGRRLSIFEKLSIEIRLQWVWNLMSSVGTAATVQTLWGTMPLHQPLRSCCCVFFENSWGCRAERNDQHAGISQNQHQQLVAFLSCGAKTDGDSNCSPI